MRSLCLIGCTAGVPSGAGGAKRLTGVQRTSRYGTGWLTRQCFGNALAVAGRDHEVRMWTTFGHTRALRCSTARLSMPLATTACAIDALIPSWRLEDVHRRTAGSAARLDQDFCMLVGSYSPARADPTQSRVGNTMPIRGDAGHREGLGTGDSPPEASLSPAGHMPQAGDRVPGTSGHCRCCDRRRSPGASRWSPRCD